LGLKLQKNTKAHNFQATTSVDYVTDSMLLYSAMDAYATLGIGLKHMKHS